MKPKELADALRKGADVLAPNDAVQLRLLADVFDASPGATVAATMTRLRKAGLAPATGYPSMGDVLTALAPLGEFVKHYGKPALAKDLQAIALYFQGISNAGVRAFFDDALAELSRPAATRPVLREEVVQRHLQQLERTLGDDPTFTAAYNEMDSDPEVGPL